MTRQGRGEFTRVQPGSSLKVGFFYKSRKPTLRTVLQLVQVVTIIIERLALFIVPKVL